MSTTLREAKRLWDEGLAIHWLHPKSKRPVGNNWTSGPRKSWDELEKAHQPGQNVGVRLGGATMIGTEYLAVVDCDCKSADPRHRAEMEAKVMELWPGLPLDAPRVGTGRGNGSGHIYVMTDEPVKPERRGQSGEKVKVKMPSAKPSRTENESLTKTEIADGWRLRPAWEISVMGEGQQVVLPPSIHPDTGKSYKWAFPLVSGPQIPVVDLGVGAPPGLLLSKDRPRPELARNGDFHALTVDLVGSRLPDSTVNMILDGAASSDKSADLFSVCQDMVRVGFTDDEILSVLTDPDTFLGQVAFDHAQTTSRGRAARWLYDYTLKKARNECDARMDFEAAVEVAELDAEGAVKQSAELTPEKHWRELIERESEKSGFRPKNTQLNVVLILKGEFGPTLFKSNLFAGIQHYGVKTPWAKVGDEITDEHTILFKHWFANRWRFEPGLDRINEAITVISQQNEYHPVKDYLEPLRWDGVPRIDTWLKDYLGAEGPEPYLTMVSRKVMAALITRIYEPGCKFDHVLILEGNQGIGKSTALKNLVSEPWFSDAKIDVSDKDGVLAMRSAWLMELGELSAMRQADVDQLKEFISRCTDKIRVPYGRRTQAFPRQCIFVGTTNRSDYLRDQTGNRRFWPVALSNQRIDFDRVRVDRDQLLAEAMIAYTIGEKLYLDEKSAEEIAIVEQAARMQEDVWTEKVENFFDAERAKPEADRHFNPDLFSMGELFSDWGPMAGVKDDVHMQKRAGGILRLLGYECHQSKSGKRRTRLWFNTKCFTVRPFGLLALRPEGVKQLDVIKSKMGSAH